MTLVLVGALGFLVGLAAHDLAVQGLTDTEKLRPLVGACPQCHTRRGWLHPRCPRCARSIQREPIVGAASALFTIAFVHGFGLEPILLPYLGFLLLTAALLVTDLEEFRIVDRLNLRGSLILGGTLGMVALFAGEGSALWRGVLGASAYFAGATLIWLAVRGRGFGAGDVKLAPILGLFTAYISWGTLGWAVFSTALIGGVIAFAMIIMGAAKMKTELPYGPPMIMGAWLAIILAGIGSFPIPT